MVMLKFTATPGMRSYHDMPNWTDGYCRGVEDEVAKILLRDFPDNFSVVISEKAIKGAKDKSVKGKKTK